MLATEVRPENWSRDENYPIRILFDDSEYSIIWGKYITMPCVGVRWNHTSDENNIGFPVSHGYPTWYIESDFIAVSILQRLLTMAIDHENYEHLDDIKFAIAELNKQYPEM